MRDIYTDVLPRLYAAVIDVAVLCVLALMIGLLPMVHETFLAAFNSFTNDYAWLLIGVYLFTRSYHLFFLKIYASTPGKMLFNMRVVRVNGKPLTLCVVLLRHSIFPLLVVGVLLTLHFLLIDVDLYFAAIVLLMTVMIWSAVSAYMLLTREDRKVVHDVIAGTVVVKKIVQAESPRLPKTWTTSSSSF